MLYLGHDVVAEKNGPICYTSDHAESLMNDKFASQDITVSGLLSVCYKKRHPPTLWIYLSDDDF